MRVFLFLIFTALFIASCNSKKDKETMPLSVSRFSWLHGKWTMLEKDGITTEEWQPGNDSLMTGKSDFVKGDSVIPFETIKIFIRDTIFYYEAKAAGQNNEQPVEFKMTSFSDSGFVAENPQHDFPKRITYRKISKDSIHAFIDGGEAMPDKRADFYYARKNTKP